jgi:hypothetical protein
MLGLCYNYGVDRSAWDEKWEELDLFSRIIRKGSLPQEIPDSDAIGLKKYFGWQLGSKPALFPVRVLRQ